ncbi:MAG: discoidin domain-containing protein [Lachnospiraceae bacterium]|nr:discoidin domain-containing protein [Lachnospiraceae bacterium]
MMIKTRKRRTLASKTMSGVLAATMVVGMMPTFSGNVDNVNAAANDPYAVSVGRMVYASSSVGNSDPAYAVDGSTSTRWESAWDNATEWMYVDLGKVTQITGVNLYWEGAFAKAYNIQVSNDENNWSQVYSTTTGNGGNQQLNINTQARYVRINMTQKQLPAYGYSLYEFEVMGLDGITKRPVDYGTNIAQGKNVSASSLRDIWWMYDDNGVIDQSTVLAQNAIDGKDNTHWTSGQEDKQWITVDLGRNYTIGRVVLDWESDAGKIYDIQVSTDGNNFTTLYRQTRGHAFETADIPLYATARYVRMYGYTRVESGSGFSLKEFKVYEYKNGDARPTYSIPALPQSHMKYYKKGNLISNDMYLEQAKLPVYIDGNLSAPIDSNDWWQSSLINKFGNPMSTLPFKTKFSTKGLSVTTTTEGWLPTMGPTDVNVSVVTENEVDFSIMPENLDTATACDKVVAYSDYAVTLGLYDDTHQAMKATFVKGSPYIFTEYGDTRTVYLSAPALAEIYNGAGNTILTNNLDAVTADHIGIKIVDSDNKNRTKTSETNYCLTVPEGTVFKKIGNYIKITFPGANGYMSIATMTNKNQIGTFFAHGYAFPTDTNVTYDYDENQSVVKSYYTVTTNLKRGGFSNETIQCMLPHQWKHSTDDNGSFATFTSVRGDMKAVVKNQFQTSATFAGLLPTFATPSNNDFDSQALLAYLSQLDDATKNLNPAGDAYWEGKNLHPLGMGVLMADQIGETELRDAFLKRIKKILVNWFTYDGPDDVSYFIYNENWGTLFYKNSEFGANAAICDHHFTYGYFMFAATVLATYDQEFYNDYKDMIELLIRDYANPSDTDNEYCRFRAYDLYEGHSWAGGYADNDSGNNQESASESLFSWVSMYLWGVLTQNDAYRDAGVFGFSNEMEAVEQYWFDYDKDNWINDWPYEVVGQVYGSINFYGTFFGGQPLYVYGIQWLPISEYLTYYGMNQSRCAEIYAGLERDTDVAMAKAETVARNEGKSQAEIDKMIREYPHQDTGWQHITWPFLSQTNPDRALNLFNTHASEVQRTDTANTYWFINAMKELGVKTTDIVATGDCSAAVYNKNGKYTAVVWNPTNETKVVNFKSNGNYVGKATVGAKALVSFEVFKNRNFDIVQAQTPVISVPTGTYDDTKYVEISSGAGTTIYYTTDGTRPTRNSKVYTGVFAVSTTATVKAIAVKDGNIDSPMASSTITVNGTAVSGNVNLAQGKNAVASSAENASVGADKAFDNDKSTRWSSGFNDNESIYVDLGSNKTINKVVLDWEASYASAYKIQVSSNANNWQTVYETSNGKGGKEEIVFDAITCRYVRMQGVKRALAYGYSLWEMGVYEAAKVSNVAFSLPSGAYQGNQTININCATKGVEIRYTTDGSTPNANSKLYIPGIKINQTTTIKAIAYRKGMIESGVVTATYTINGGSELPTEPPTETPTQPGTNPGDGVNIAQGKQVIASGAENDAMAAANAVDGNDGTRWSSNFADNAWITVDLGATYSVNKVAIKWEAAYGKNYRIQTSTNGTNFTTVKTVNGSDGGDDEITFDATNARYVRMQGVERALPYGYSIWEMKVYAGGSQTGGSGEPETTTQANNGNYRKLAVSNATASGVENEAMAASNAVDGNTGTRWSSNFADNAWITFDLGATYSVDKLVLNWEGAYGESYDIYVSTDGNNFTKVKSLTGMKGGVDTVTFNATNARYVKLQGVHRGLPYGYSLWEAEVWGR